MNQYELTMYVQHFGFVHQTQHLSGFVCCSPEAVESSFSGTDGTLQGKGK